MAFALFACEDFLTEEPKLEQTNELTLSTYTGLNDATAGVYTTIYSTNWYGRYLPVFGDLKAGNAKLSPKSSGRIYWRILLESVLCIYSSFMDKCLLHDF